MLVITVNEKLLIKYPIDGTLYFNEMLAQYRDNILTWGQGKIKTSRSSTGVLTIEIPREANIPFMTSHFGMMMSLDGGSVSGYKPYIAVDEDMYDMEIPEGLPNRTYEIAIDDGDPESIVTETRIHTWKSWVKPNYTVDLIEGKYYYLSYAVTDKARAMTGDELMIIYAETPNGVTLIDSVPQVDDIIV